MNLWFRFNGISSNDFSTNQHQLPESLVTKGGRACGVRSACGEIRWDAVRVVCAVYTVHVVRVWCERRRGEWYRNQHFVKRSPLGAVEGTHIRELHK